jgi:hypothetical protein
MPWRPLALALVLLALAFGAGHDDGPANDVPRPPHDIADDLPFAATTSTTATRYASCAAAWDAGGAPVRRGDPGYGPHLDRDGDGIACEDDPR